MRARGKVRARCTAILLWRNAWPEFIPFLDYGLEIRRVVCSNNAIECLNARYGRAVKARVHFPTEQAAMKCLYLVTGRPQWHRQDTMGSAVEARPECLRRYLRRPDASRREPLTR